MEKLSSKERIAEWRAGKWPVILSIVMILFIFTTLKLISTPLDERLQAAGVPAKDIVFGACGGNVDGPYMADLSGMGDIDIVRSESVSYGGTTALKLVNAEALEVYSKDGLTTTMDYLGSYSFLTEKYTEEEWRREVVQYHFFSSDLGLVVIRDEALFFKYLDVVHELVRYAFLARVDLDLEGEKNDAIMIDSVCGGIFVGDGE